jgi:hypothetical protein
MSIQFCKQFAIPQCVHWLNVPVLCFVFGLMMAQWAETCRRITNICCVYWVIKLLYYYCSIVYPGVVREPGKISGQLTFAMCDRPDTSAATPQSPLRRPTWIRHCNKLLWLEELNSELYFKLLTGKAADVLYSRLCSWPSQRGSSPLTLVAAVVGNHTFCQTVVGNHTFCQDGRGKSYILSRRSWEIIHSVKTVVGNHKFCQDGRGKSYILSRRSWEIIHSVKSTILCHCMTYFSNTARHLLVVSFITSLNSNLYTVISIQNTKENNCIISHAQNTTALQPNVSLTGIMGRWSQPRGGRLSQAQTTGKVTCKLHSHYM